MRLDEIFDIWFRARAKITVAVMAVTLLSAVGILAADVLTPEDIARLSYVSEIAVSPDGEQIVYTRVIQRDPFEDNGSAWKELHLVDRRGHSRPYVTGRIKISQVKFTPDGSGISFLAERGEDTVKSLYAIPVDGGEAERLIEFKTSIREYDWASDGKRVAFLAREPRSSELEVERKAGFDQEVYEEDWRSVKVWIADVTPVESEPRLLELDGSASELHWSPRGDRLAMALAPTPLVDDKYTSRKVTLVDPANGEIVFKADNPGKLGDFAWSPDGAHLAFIFAADIHDPADGRLAVVAADGTGLNTIVGEYEGHVRTMAWRSDRHIVYLSDEGVSTRLVGIDFDGSKSTTILDLDRPVFTRMDLSDDGKVLGLVGENYNHPSEVFALELADPSPTRLTDHNSWLSSISLGVQEVVEYQARDGLKLQGVLMRPVDEQPGRAYPLIMVVHGGPEAHRRDGWLTYYSSPGQIAAGRSFAVFYPNYRGSTGRGIEFSKMGQGDYAGAEFDDLVDAIDYLAGTGLVDRERVGITGGSYGGYASAWGATALSEHFAASVMGFGVSDLISKYGTTDIPVEMYLVHALSWPWEKWDWMLERSPIYHAENSRTPTLILHGDEDPRVHPSQSLELYRYLKTHGQAPVRLVLYPGEEHGNSKAAARYDYCRRQIRWLEHYLVGPGGDPPPYPVDYSPLKEASNDGSGGK